MKQPAIAVASAASAAPNRPSHEEKTSFASDCPAPFSSVFTIDLPGSPFVELTFPDAGWQIKSRLAIADERAGASDDDFGVQTVAQQVLADLHRHGQWKLVQDLDVPWDLV